MGLFDPDQDESVIDGGGLPLDLSSFGSGGTPAPQKTDWAKLAPLLTLLPIALSKGGRVGGAALLRGFQGSQDKRRSQSRQDQQDQEGRDYRQAQLASLKSTRDANEANQQATRRQTFLQQFGAGMDGLDSPEAVDAYLRLQGAQGQTLGINPEDLRAMAPAPTSLQQRAAKKRLADLDKQFGAKLMEFGPQFTYQLAGEQTPVTFDELLRRSGQGRDPNYVAPPAEAGDLSKSGLDVQLADAKRRLARGDAAAAQDVKIIEDTIARADSLRRDPADPSIAAMRGLQMELAQQRLIAAQTQLPAATVRRIDAKAKGFDQQPAVKNTQLMAEASSFADSLDVNTTNPAADIGLIYAFAKAMDPNSVVREGEYATVQKYAQSWAESFRFNAQRIFSNTAFLTPEARMNMKKIIRSKFLAGKNQYDALRKSYADQINSITKAQDGDSYLTDYGAAFPKDAAAAATPGAAPSYQDYLRTRGGQ